MAAKHARHDMREDKNFKGTDPSETTAQYLYCDASKQNMETQKVQNVMLEF